MTEHATARTPQISDAEAMRALTHPLRLALIELLWREGSVTATEASRELGPSQASCSFHLRQLARFGFVVEVEGVKGRARPWRLTGLGLRFSNVHDDPESDIAWAALERLLRGRQMERYRGWLENRSRYSEAWREAAFHSQHVAWLTPDELDDLAERVTDLLTGVARDRRNDPTRRPAGALSVELIAFAYPIARETAES